MHRSRVARIAALLTILELAPARLTAAEAGPKDEEALALSRQALAVDYLAVQLDAAKAKLQRALQICGGNACSPHVVATVHRDLGVVYAAGYKQHEDAVVEFTQALTVDSSLELDPDLATDEVRAAFSEAASNLGLAPKAAPVPEQKETKSVPDLVHASPAEQLLNAPVPIYVEGPPGTHFTKVRIRYRAFGVPEWNSVDLEPLGDGWGGEIPCADVTTTGDLEYYVQAYDASGDVEVQSGTRQQPQKVPIVHQLRGAPPHLPGRAPPTQCREKNDCPPDFPGCGERALPPPILRPIEFPILRNWFSLAVEQNFLLLGSATEVCDAGSDYDCFHTNGDPYDATTNPVGGDVVAGVVPATTRIVAGYDRVLGRHLTAGARAGFAFGGAPTGGDGGGFFPFVFELRGAYFWGRDPFAKHGFRPFVSAAAGIAEVDAKVRVNVFANQRAAEAGQVSELDAWRKTGLFFAALGAGTAFAVGDMHAITAELLLSRAFGNAGTGLSLNIGYTMGI